MAEKRDDVVVGALRRADVAIPDLQLHLQVAHRRPHPGTVVVEAQALGVVARLDALVRLVPPRHLPAGIPGNVIGL